MRISNQYTFYTSIKNYTDGQSLLNKYNLQLQTGQIIQHSWENANIYINGSRLEYEMANIGQIIEGTKAAQEMAKNTDTALKNITELLEKFKTLLVKASSDGNSQTSREAIAKELKLIKESIVNIANTSINGQYLFAGSNTATKPFDKYGNYTGNKDNIFVVSGAGTQIPYNIPGWDLFFKPDSNENKLISTNVSFIDNRYDVMKNPEQKKYLDENSKFSYLIGQNYVQHGPLDPDKDFDYIDSKLPFPSSSMYIQGVRPDGTSFKATLNIGPEDKIGDVLENIGKLYGNTAGNKVVDVTMNDSGQIEIKNLKEGNSSLDFHAVAMTPQLQDAEEIKDLSAAAAAEGITMDQLADRIMQATHGGNLNNAVNPVTVTVNGQNFTMNIHTTDFIKSSINGNRTNGGDFDVPFEKDGNKVFGNVSQIIKGTSEYATESTKLSEVIANANGSMNGQKLEMNITSKSGQNYKVEIDLGNSMVSYVDPATGANINFPIIHSQYNEATGTSSGVQTRPEDITYGQLNDIISMFAADKAPTASISVGTGGTISNSDFQTIQTNISDSKDFIEVSMDYKGRITISDKFSTNTNIGLTIKDSNSNAGFPTTGGQVNSGSGFVFSANNSLTIDDPNVDLIKDLDEMIDAVLNGNMRADSEGKDPRNTGLQGALERIDHLQDHVRKMHTTIGSYTNTIEETNKRMTFLNVNVASIKSGVTDADYGQTYMQFMQTMISYQAMLSATSKISQISLLNYL